MIKLVKHNHKTNIVPLISSYSERSKASQESTNYTIKSSVIPHFDVIVGSNPKVLREMLDSITS